MAESVRKTVRQQKTAVVDATFYHHTMRDFFKQIAGEESVPIYFILIETDEPVARQRLSVNRTDSEADFGVYLTIKSQFEKYDFPHLKLFSSNNNIEEMLSKTIREVSAVHE